MAFRDVNIMSYLVTRCDSKCGREKTEWDMALCEPCRRKYFAILIVLGGQTLFWVSNFLFYAE